VLLDNAKALITNHNPRTGELVINPVFAAILHYWGFTPKACWPSRPAALISGGTANAWRDGTAGCWTRSIVSLVIPSIGFYA
jgi:hypothetical protein